MPALECTATVRELKWLTPSVFQIGFDLEGTSVPFVAGQWASIVIPGAGAAGKDLRRAYSIASPPDRLPRIELCIKRLEGGPGTTYLSTRKPGDTLRLFLPYGSFVYKTPRERDACFIATGTGISPFRSILSSQAYLASPARRAYCLLGVRDETEVLYRGELGSRSDVEWIETVSRPSPGAQVAFAGRVTDWLRQARDLAWRETDYYLCGNSAMIDEVKQWLQQEHGVERSALHQEIYYKG